MQDSQGDEDVGMGADCVLETASGYSCSLLFFFAFGAVSASPVSAT